VCAPHLTGPGRAGRGPPPAPWSRYLLRALAAATLALTNFTVQITLCCVLPFFGLMALQRIWESRPGGP
jgi:hypothetical protein